MIAIRELVFGTQVILDQYLGIGLELFGPNGHTAFAACLVRATCSGMRKKVTSALFVADGHGGIRPVEDLRFDKGDWPVRFWVPARRAAAC